LIDGNLEGAVVIDRLHVDTQVAEDLQGKVAKWDTRALYQFARVRLSHGQPEELSCRLEYTWLLDLWLIDIAREGVQVADQVLQVVVMYVGLKSEFVLERDCVGGDQVEAVDLCEKILFAELSVLLVSLIDVDPDEASQILGGESELCPVFAAVIVALIGRGASEAQCETDDETKNGKEELVDADWKRSIHVAC
jgi:hypothetical protein